jgi:hypothetical protein
MFRQVSCSKRIHYEAFMELVSILRMNILSIVLTFTQIQYSSGLQTMFNGEYPRLIIYDTNGNTIQEYDLRELDAAGIEKLILKHGLQKINPPK